MKKLLSCMCLAVLVAFNANATDLGRISARAEVQFAPSPDSTASVVKFIGEAKTSILVCAYELTNLDVSNALIQAAAKGVKVRVVVDSPQYSLKYSRARAVGSMGADVRYNVRSGIMHNKFIVVDNMHLETGSFNYSDSAATRNAENILIMRGSSALAHSYTAQFETLWNASLTADQMAARTATTAQ